MPGPEHRASCLEAAEAAPGGAYAGGALSAAEEAGPEQQKSWEFVVQGQQDPRAGAGQDRACCVAGAGHAIGVGHGLVAGN